MRGLDVDETFFGATDLNFIFMLNVVFIIFIILRRTQLEKDEKHRYRLRGKRNKP